MSLFKFFQNQGPEHNGRLFWSESNPGGLPFRGPGAPLLSGNEIDELTDVVCDFHVEEFDLNVPEQKQAYIDVMERAANDSWYMIMHIERTGLKRIVEWVQRYNQLKPSARERLGVNSGAPHVHTTNGHSQAGQ